jgi:hypothetical protein
MNYCLCFLVVLDNTSQTLMCVQTTQDRVKMWFGVSRSWGLSSYSCKKLPVIAPCTWDTQHTLNCKRPMSSLKEQN